jgi:hypothetical protein
MTQGCARRHRRFEGVPFSNLFFLVTLLCSTTAFATRCGDNEYDATPGSETPTCLPWTVCSSEEYERVSPSDTRDRDCAPLTNCGWEDGPYLFCNWTARYGGRICGPQKKGTPGFSLHFRAGRSGPLGCDTFPHTHEIRRSSSFIFLACIANPEGTDYRGNQSVTRSGRVCQAWSAQTPHAHSFSSKAYPDAGLEANYCRNPGMFVRLAISRPREWKRAGRWTSTNVLPPRLHVPPRCLRADCLLPDDRSACGVGTMCGLPN